MPSHSLFKWVIAGHQTFSCYPIGGEAMALFDRKLSTFLSDSTDWKEAIKAGVKVLARNGYATADLADAIFQTTEKYGAYYVLTKGVALAHAPLGKYCLKPGVSLVLLPKEIIFNNEPEKTAKIIAVLSSPDQTSHIKFIQEFGNLFGDEGIKDTLLKSKSLEEFFTNYERFAM